MRRLLLIEDEEIIVKALCRLLKRNHFEVETAGSIEQAQELKPHTFDLILADLRLPGGLGTDIIPQSHHVPVIIMTSHASVRSAVDAMRSGAIDYIAKPFDHDELLLVIDRALKQNLLRSQNKALHYDLQRTQNIRKPIEGSFAQTLLKQWQSLQKETNAVHLFGEQGTGREALARLFHVHSNQQEAPFLVVDSLASFQEYLNNLTVTATSASENNIELHNDEHELESAFRLSHLGTLVVRFPEQLDAETQRALYTQISNRSESDEIPAATKHRVFQNTLVTISQYPAARLVSDHGLLPEFGKWLEQSEFEVPPLRSRHNEVIPESLSQLAYLSTQLGGQPFKLTDDAESALQACQWPGNDAELHSVLARAALTARSHVLNASDLALGSEQAAGGRERSLDEYFRYFVLQHQGVLSETELAARLGISRKALWERRQKMNLLRDSAGGGQNPT